MLSLSLCLSFLSSSLVADGVLVLVLVSVELWLLLEGVDCSEGRPVGDRLSVDESILNDDFALLTTWPSCTFVVWAIWPQPWPCERSARMPGKFDDELEVALVVVLVEVEPAAASGPPISTAFHWSGVAQPLMPAARSASAAMASVMYASP